MLHRDSPIDVGLHLSYTCASSVCICLSSIRGAVMFQAFLLAFCFGLGAFLGAVLVLEFVVLADRLVRALAARSLARARA